MTLRPLPVTAALLLLASPVLFAQQTSANEEERMEALTRADTANWYVPKSNVSIGFRVLGSGAKVNFGSLGNITANLVTPVQTGEIQRIYNNGFVSTDVPRPAELDAAGAQVSPQGGRYITTATVTGTDGVDTTFVTGDFLSFTTGLTRSWSYGASQQAAVRPGYIGMSIYSATSDGVARENKQGPSGGVEMSYEQTVFRLSKHTELRLLTGIALNDINSKVDGDISATLHTYTDFFSLNGQAAPTTSPETPYTAPSFADLFDSSGNLIAASGLETTTPVSVTPAAGLSTNTTTVGGAAIHGNYQVKGAYFMLKLGPSIRTQLTERLGVTASVGVAGAYAGSRYSVVESMDIPDVGGKLTSTEQNTATKFLSGYYADLNIEWLANERTGLFGGFTAQKFDDYDQTVGGRTAHIDLGSTVGIRGGISIKF